MRACAYLYVFKGRAKWSAHHETTPWRGQVHRLCGTSPRASFPKFGPCLLEPPRQAHDGHAPREAGGILSFEGEGAQGRLPQSRLEARPRDFAQKARKRLLLVHPDHRVVVAGHADIGDEGRAL